MAQFYLKQLFLVFNVAILSLFANAQKSFTLKYEKSTVCAGIEVGSKGVKMSILEIGKNAKKSGSFNVLKDTSINTDFISFTAPSFYATVKALSDLYKVANSVYGIQGEHIFTVISSGVKIQADKANKNTYVNGLIDSFKIKSNLPQRKVDIVSVSEEARLSHLGIVPEYRRFNTFLIDIGSGNTKGGYFPNGNTKEMKLFQLTWGTKSTANEADKRCIDDKSVANYNKQLYRVLAGNANAEIVYAVNESDAYAMNDYVAFSGGIAWSVANLLYPELIENSVVPVTYADVLKFSERLVTDYASFSDAAITKKMLNTDPLKNTISQEVKRVNQVFDQKSLMAGTGLLLKIMRQFEGVYERKQFYLVKNGQVGWISAYVDQFTNK
jgi:hypothetical protein